MKEESKQYNTKKSNKQKGERVKNWGNWGKKNDRPKTNSKIAELKASLSVIILGINGLNSPIRRQRLAELIKRHDPTICCLQKTHFRFKDTKRWKVKEWKNICAVNNQKKGWLVILISDKVDFN